MILPANLKNFEKLGADLFFNLLVKISLYSILVSEKKLNPDISYPLFIVLFSDFNVNSCFGPNVEYFDISGKNCNDSGKLKHSLIYFGSMSTWPCNTQSTIENILLINKLDLKV